MLLITGATGFIGRNLLKNFSKEQKIYVLVRHTGSFGKNKNIIEVVGDITDSGSFSKIPKEVTDVIHLAAVIEDNNKSNLLKVNVDGTKNLIEWCQKNAINRFIFLSSLNVKLKNRGLYGDSKIIAENIIKKSQLNWTIIRPGLIYGPGDNRNLGRIISLIKKSPIFPILGSGNFYLQPIFVDDVTKIIIKIVQNNKSFKKTYELTGKEILTYIELIDKISWALGKKNLIKLYIPIWLAVLTANFLAFVAPKFASSIRAYIRLQNSPMIPVRSLQQNEITTSNLTNFEEGIRKAIV